jgi:hypothetical protein
LVFPSERRLARDSATRRRIGQALALCADEDAICSLEIVDAERDPVVVPEIELGSVAVQVRLGDVEVAPIDSAFQDAERERIKLL